MPSVDDRVVRIEFDNSGFEQKIKATLGQLADLEKALQFQGATDGFSNIAAAADNVNLDGMAAAIDNIGAKFSAMGAVAFTVIQNITTGALDMVKNVGGSIFESILGRGQQRALNIEQAKFLFQGLGVDVTKSMESAKQAVLGTAFGLDEAAKTAAQFAASGIMAGDSMTGALRGVAGVAAMTNSSFSEMADIFTSAAGQGKVTGYTLERISMRGLNVAAALGQQLGKSEAEIRKMASEGKIDFKTFAKAMDDAFGAHAQEANKTYTGSLANLHAAMGRLGAVAKQPELEQQRDLFNALSPQVDKLKDALTPLIDAFVALRRLSINALISQVKGINFDGLKAAVPLIADGMTKAFIALHQVVTVVKNAFKTIFPLDLNSTIVKIATAFHNLSERLIMGQSTLDKLTRIFKGFFSIIKIVVVTVFQAAKFVWGLVSSLKGLGGGKILDSLARIGDFFTNLQEQLVAGKGIQTFFENLTKLIQKPIPYILAFKDAIVDLFKGFKPDVPDQLSASLGRVSDRFQSIKDAIDKLKDIWKVFEKAMKPIIDILDHLWQDIHEFFSTLVSNIAKDLGTSNYNAVYDAINTGLLAGIAGVLLAFFKRGFKISLPGGLIDQIKGTFSSLTDTLGAMQAKLKADTLLRIAEAIALLTASVLVLSLINSDNLSKALTAMAVGFGELIGAFALLNQMSSGVRSGASITLIATAMVIMAGAIVILAGAVALLAQLSWEDLAKGLSAVVVLLGVVVATASALKENSASLIAGGAGMMLIATALTILAGAIKLFSTMSWEDLAKGFAAVTAGLFLMVGVAFALSENALALIAGGAGMMLIALALAELAGVVALFGSMDWGTLAKGFAAVAASLLIITGFAYLIGEAAPALIVGGAGMILMGIGLNEIAASMKIFGSMSWAEIARGLTAMAGALIVLATLGSIMVVALPGAVAIELMSVALTMLVSVLKMFSRIKMEAILTALRNIAIALAGFAGIAVLLLPGIGAMILLASALMILGAAFSFIGVGIYLAAKGFDLLAKSGEDGAKALLVALESIGKAIPILVKGFVDGIIGLLKSLKTAIPLLVELLGTVIILLLKKLKTIIPLLAIVVGELITSLLTLIREKAPEYIQTGYEVLIALLKGIRDNIGEVVKLVADIIVKFLEAFAEHLNGIVQAVADLIIAFFNDVAEAIGRVAGTLLISIGVSFIKGFVQGLEDAAPGPMHWFMELPGKVIGWIGDVLSTLWQKGTDLISGLFRGVTDKIRDVISWFGSLLGKIPGWIGDSLTTLKKTGIDLLTGLYNGIVSGLGQVTSWFLDLPHKIFNAVPNTITTLLQTGKDLIKGLWNGITSVWSDMVAWIVDKISKLPGPIRWAMKALSPSRVFMAIGEDLMLGFHIGLKNEWEKVDDFMANLNVADTITNNVNNAIKDVANQMESMGEFNPVITPVLDLSRVAAGAQQIAGYIAPGEISPIYSYGQASAIAASTNAQREEGLIGQSNVAPGVKFEQNIYAPTQLSTSDIYRQTRNQITLAKKELSIP